MTKKNVFAALNVVGGALVLAGMAWYMDVGGIKVKAASCALFVLLSGINLAFSWMNGKDRKFASVMFAGALTGWMGDVLLGVNFILGAGLFAVGHVMYLIGFCMIRKFTGKDAALMAGILIGTSALILLYPKFDFGGTVMQAVCLVYGLIISCMVGKAVMGAAAEKSLPFVVMAVGSMLFYFSDLMLVLRYFADAPKLADRLCLLSYFPAQGLLAASVYFYVTRKEIN